MEHIEEKPFCCVCKHEVQVPYCHVNHDEVVCSAECYKEYVHDCQR